MTLGLITVNVVLFGISILQAPDSLLGGSNPMHELLDLWEPAVARGEWYRLVTSGFMHYGLIHLAVNMFMLFQLGRLIERSTGSIRFGLLYFASLLGGSLGVVLLTGSETTTAGASGAIFGLLGAAAVDQYLRGFNPFAGSLGTLIILNIVITVAVPFVSVGGHFGGLAMGTLCGFAVMGPQRTRRRGGAVIGYATPTVLGFVAFVAAVMLSSSQ